MRQAPSGGATTVPLSIDSVGNLVIPGAVGQKASGTTWSNPSDARMKRNVVDYTRGLDAICQLRPVAFEFNGAYGGVDTGETCYGYIAQEVEPIMPECVRDTLWTPPPPATLTDADATPLPAVTLKTLDQSNMLLALVNAVRELAARVATLEAA